MTLAGAEVNIPPPPTTGNAEAQGQGYIPDEYDDGRTIAGAEMAVPPPPPADGIPTGDLANREVDTSGANFFVRMRRTDEAGDGKTFNGVEVITIGSGSDQVLSIDHDLLAPAHARIVYRDGTFELSSLDDEEHPIVVNGKPLEGSRTLCREDEILFVGEGGPSFVVDMLYPNRDPEKSGGGDLPESLAFLSGLVTPISDKTGLAPLYVVIGLVALLVLLPCGCCTITGILRAVLMT